MDQLVNLGAFGACLATNTPNFIGCSSSKHSEGCRRRLCATDDTRGQMLRTGTAKREKKTRLHASSQASFRRLGVDNVVRAVAYWCALSALGAPGCNTPMAFARREGGVAGMSLYGDSHTLARKKGS